MGKTSSNQLSSDTDNQDDSQDSSESIKPNAIYEIVQAVRKETQLSHEMSKVAVETVLISLRVSIYLILGIRIAHKSNTYKIPHCHYLYYIFKINSFILYRMNHN